MSFYIALLDLITFLQQFGLLSWFKTLQVMGVFQPCYLENRDNNSPKITKRQEFCSCRKTCYGMKKPHKHWVYAASRWRKRWDSNSRAREDYLISSHSRKTEVSGIWRKIKEVTGSLRTAVFSGFFEYLDSKNAPKSMSQRIYAFPRVLRNF